MKRRTIVGALGALAIAIGGSAKAQRTLPTVGVLLNDAPETFMPRFVDALRRLGYEPDSKVRYEVRSAHGNAAMLPALAAELVQARVEVIVARLTPAVLAARRATQTIPVVMAGAGDPIGSGLVESLARPGRNVTGFAGIAGQLSGKLVELVQQIVPQAREIAVLANPTDVFTPIYLQEIESAGRALRINTPTIMIPDSAALRTAFERLRIEPVRAQAVIVQPTLPRSAAAAFALAQRLPSFSPVASFAGEGGLAGYAANQVELFEQTAMYVDKILRGAEPSLLPVTQASRFELIINMRTASAIGVVVPPAVLALASSVLE